MTQCTIRLLSIIFLLISQSSFAIIHGIELDWSQHPYVVRLNPGCSASIVGDSDILTAAHCIKGDGSGTAELFDGKRVKVNCIKHPLYRPQINHAQSEIYDFAICSASEYLGSYGRLELPKEADIGNAVQVDQKITVLGFGCTGIFSRHDFFRSPLRAAITQIVGLDSARINLSGDDSASICFGDSGGPGVRVIDGKLIQVGIHSAMDFPEALSVDIRTDTKVFYEWAREKNFGSVGRN